MINKTKRLSWKLSREKEEVRARSLAALSAHTPYTRVRSRASFSLSVRLYGVRNFGRADTMESDAGALKLSRRTTLGTVQNLTRTHWDRD
jgi:hypothetical protein